MNEANEQNKIFSEEALNNIVNLYCILRKIHNRLIAEGYTFKDNKIYPPEVEVDNS